MPRVVSYLDKDLIESIKKLYYGHNQSLSTMIAELIDIGYKVKQHHEARGLDDSIATGNEVSYKHTEYLLKIMAIVADIYRYVRNERSKYDEKHVEDVLTKITTDVKNYIYM